MKPFLSKTILISAACVLFSSTVSATPSPAPDPRLLAELRKSDVILLKAVHTADRDAWRSLAAPDFFYLDEAGGVTYLDQFLKELEPMRSPPLEIQSYKLTRAGDTAIVLHEDTDQDQVRYIFTETWQRLGGTWRLRALHITNVLSDPPAMPLSEAQIDELSGTYQRGDRTYTIRRDGTRIVSRRSDQAKDVEQKAETRDSLFEPGGDPRQRIVFLRDAAGKVTGLVVRYESSDKPWKKI